ncbi:MAG TPA: hypothetical protein VF411_12505 [Bacteroidia bacterium]
MPRKENIPLEERLQQARQQYSRKQAEKQQQLKELRQSKIYKLARKSCIAFLWIAQLIVIDWLLPYTKTQDVIIAGYQIKEKDTTTYYFKEAYLNITTAQHKEFELALNEGSPLPEINDSVQILKSLLLREAKKVTDINKRQTYLVSSSLTYMLLPVLIILSALSILFLFIKNIELKAFYYFMFLSNIAAILGLLGYYLFRI